VTKKITISVPDELHEKMEKWKDSYNFSRVFQEAIGEKIQRKEAFQERLKGDPDMEAIVERLKQEKLSLETDRHESGKNDGLRWAKSADYEDLQYVLGWNPDNDSWNHGKLPHDLHEQNESLDDYFNEIIESDSLLEYDSYTGEPTSHLTEYVAGWTEGVAEFWNEIESKLQ